MRFFSFFFLSYRVFNWMQGLNWTSMIITRLERTNKPVCLYNSPISFELVHEPSGFLDNPNIQIPALLSYLLLTSQWSVKIAKRICLQPNFLTHICILVIQFASWKFNLSYSYRYFYILSYNIRLDIWSSLSFKLHKFN